MERDPLFADPRLAFVRTRLENNGSMGASRSDVYPGWVDIVAELDAEIAKIEPAYILDQVKEKFGGLRYYVRTTPETSEQIQELIRAAEERASRTCQICGQPGRAAIGGFGFYMTRCDDDLPADAKIYNPEEL